jgi:hypothetical protein
MVTRRTVLGAGLAFASMICNAGPGATVPALRRRSSARSIDVLLIDQTIELPRQVSAFITASSRTMRVVGIEFEAAAQAGLSHVLDNSHAVAGISCGATLFCLERIAWDHGFRLTGRSQRCADRPGDDAREAAAFLCGAHSAAASPALLARAYRPSRADGILHAWVMQKSARPQLRQRTRES